MYMVGKKAQIPGAESLVSFEIRQKPTAMPYLQSDEHLLCGVDQGLGEVLYECTDLQDVLTLWDQCFVQGLIMNVTWYRYHGDVQYLIINPDL